MGTITITSAGFGPLPVATPANWPVGLVWFGNGVIAPNGTRQATITDAEMLQLITWAAADTVPNGTQLNPATTTIAQVLVGWISALFSLTKTKIQQHFTTPAVPASSPPPINLN